MATTSSLPFAGFSSFSLTLLLESASLASGEANLTHRLFALKAMDGRPTDHH